MRSWKRALALIAAAALAGCSQISDALSADPRQLLSLTTATRTIPADGATRVAVTARASGSTAPANRAITFTTTAGTLLGSSSGSLILQLGSDGTATALLEAPTRVGAAVVQATAGSALTQSLTVDFLRAPPTRIDLDAQKAALNVLQGDHAMVVAHLRRSPGVASEGTQVEFSAVDGRGQPIGSFISITLSSANGDATATFGVPSSSPDRGAVALIARVRDADTGNVVEGRTSIDLID